MTAIVILGMHRSGTSLVAQMLAAMGVNMGRMSTEPMPHNDNGLWEDLDFVQANGELLHEAGGDWANVPSMQAIDEAGSRMRHALESVVLSKQKPGLWGWKDPRNSLTAHLWHRHLNDPRYIVVRRDQPDVVASLVRRNGAQPWHIVHNAYQERIGAFVASVDAPVLELRYEDLTHPRAAVLAVKKLAAFVGLDNHAAARALDCVEYGDRWGFGRIGIGVPYYKACYQFFRWWSRLLVSGLENGDVLLNDNSYKRPMPIPMGHNTLAKRFLETSADTLCIVEDDHAAQADHIEQMRYKLENQRFDIVCASYVNRRNDLTAVGYNFSGDRSEYGEYGVILNPMAVQRTGTQEYDGAALGCVLIRRWVLEAMQGDRAQDEWYPFDWHGGNSQDIVFYARAHALGARTGVDRDNSLIHVGDHEYTQEQFFEQRDRALQEEKAKAEVMQNG
mgnify:CR=1 FL=1